MADAAPPTMSGGSSTQPAVETTAPPAPGETTMIGPAATGAETEESAGRPPPAGTPASPTKAKPRDEAAGKDSLSIDRTGGDDDAADAADAADGGPVCNITLLLPTGARHPYRIDERYLAKRSVEVPELTEAGKKDPFSISVYKLKELILREWRDEWDGKPASPSSIRLIHFGKLLEDKEQLKSTSPITHHRRLVLPLRVFHH